MAKKKKGLGVRGLEKESEYSKEYQEFMALIRQKINALRNKQNLTIEEMAASELSVRQIKRILNGEVNNFTIAYLFKMAKALQVKPWELVNIEEKE